MSMAAIEGNEWFIFENGIDAWGCNKIIQLGEDEWEKAAIGARNIPNDPEGAVDPLIRKSDICWITEEWLYELCYRYMLEANELAGWNLDVVAAEEVQLTRYKIGGHYDWHQDGFQDAVAAYDRNENPILHGKVRKISMSLILNDDFEGGALEFASHRHGKTEIIPIVAKAGDMIFFTSGMEHRVTPVTKGVRYSLVNWFVGPPIK